MKRIILLALATSLSIIVNAQKIDNDKMKSEKNSFKHPVLCKLIQGEGNIFRIGFIRKSDYFGTEENPNNIYANFMDLANVTTGDFKNKYFVFFPLSKSNGEMIIIDRKDVTKLDMRYEQAMELIVVNRNQ